jgi:hypothetical protein
VFNIFSMAGFREWPEFDLPFFTFFQSNLSEYNKVFSSLAALTIILKLFIIKYSNWFESFLQAFLRFKTIYPEAQ